MEPESKKLSEIILEAMRVKNMNIEKLAQLTGVSDRFLENLLEENFSKLPAAPYLRGYLLKISETLNLDGQELWKTYFKNNKNIHRSGSKDMLPANRFLVKGLSKKIIITSLIILFILFFIIYIALRLPAFLAKPSLDLINVPDGLTVDNPNFTILGKIAPGDQLTINNELVYPTNNGQFEKKVNLQPGFNTFEFRVKRFLGGENIITKLISYRIPQNTTTSQKNNDY